MAFDPTKFGLKPVAPEQAGNLPSAMSSLRQEETMGVPSITEGKDDNLLVKIGKALGMGSLGESIGRGLFKFTPESRRLDELVSQGKVKSREDVLGKAPTTGQVVGSTLQTAALGIPLGAAAGLGERALQFGGTGLVQGLGSAMEQEKGGAETVKQTLLTGVISAALPVVGKGIVAGVKATAKPVSEISLNLISQLTGKEPEILKRAFSNPEAVGKAVAGQVIPSQVRDEAISVLKTAGNATKESFDNGLEALQKAFPVKKGVMYLELADGTKQSIDGVLAPEMISAKIGNIGAKVANTVRDFRVGISRSGKLDFEKLTSAIVSPAERKNIQTVVSTVLHQKDFTPKGMQAVAEKIGNLSDFAEGPMTKSSAVVAKIAKAYEKAMTNVYPDLIGLRKNYSVYKKMENALRPLLRQEATKPDAVTTSLTKLQNIFKENNVEYMKALQKLEEKSGKDFLSQIAGSQLKAFATGSYGSRIAEGGLIAGGIFVNPLLLAVLPLFSPRVAGKGAMLLGKISRTAAKAAPAVSELGAKTTDLRRVGLVELVKQLAK